MVFGPEILMAHSLFVLATAQKGADTCQFSKPPAIKVDMKTEPIRYDFSVPAATLNQRQTDGVSPYSHGTEYVSGGMREDKPEVRTEMSWNIRYEQRSNIGCMVFDDITVTIKLSPKIFVAREFNQGQCREEILGHEKKHIEVDRKVMNRYAVSIGNQLQKIVSQMGPVGPFNMKDLEKMKEQASRVVEDAINAQTRQMDAEMRIEQAKVDTLEEYQRVSSFCRDIKLPSR